MDTLFSSEMIIHKHTFFLLFIFITQFSFSQNCEVMLANVNNAIQHAQHNLDSTLKASGQPEYIESYIVYPVISRYYNKTKNKDTALIRRFPDFERSVWCYKGTCFNNNRSFYLNKKEILDKIKNNDLRDGYQRETICMLCDKYLLDTIAVIKLLDYEDTLNVSENSNAICYTLLHKVLQLSALKTNKCIDKNLFERYQFRLTNKIYSKFVDTYLFSKERDTLPSNNYDLFAESVLMISILDDKINISDNLYDDIIKNQHSDGGWSINTTDLNSSGHTTVVCLWALLDYQKKLTNVIKNPK